VQINQIGSSGQSVQAEATPDKGWPSTVMRVLGEVGPSDLSATWIVPATQLIKARPRESGHVGHEDQLVQIDHECDGEYGGGDRGRTDLDRIPIDTSR